MLEIDGNEVEGFTYIKVSPYDRTVSRTESIDRGNVIENIDYDEDGNVVGIEILDKNS